MICTQLHTTGFWAAGASHDSPRTPNVHISGPRRFKHHQNFTKRPPREGRKKEKCGRRGKKKSAKFWASHPSGHHFVQVWSPPLRAPLFLGLVPTPSGPPPFGAPLCLGLGSGPHPSGPHFCTNRKRPTKVVWAKSCRVKSGE